MTKFQRTFTSGRFFLKKYKLVFFNSLKHILNGYKISIKRKLIRNECYPNLSDICYQLITLFTLLHVPYYHILSLFFYLVYI